SLDLGCLVGDSLYLSGRDSDFINLGGEKLSPYEIEEVANQFDQVEAVVAIALPHEILGEQVGILIQSDNFSAERIVEFRNFLLGKLPNIKILKKVFIVSEIPMSNNGKLDRNQLRNWVLKKD